MALATTTSSRLIAALLLAAVLPASASALNTYSVTPVTAPPGASVSSLNAINAGGEVVGSGAPAGDNDTGTCGFAWQSGVFTWLTPGYEHETSGGGDNCAGPGSGEDDAFDLNDSGEIVGDTYYLWTTGGGSSPYPSYVEASSWKTAFDAPTPIGSDCTVSDAPDPDNGSPGFSRALAVNDAGTVAGDAQTSADPGCTFAADDSLAFVSSPTNVVAPPSGCACGSTATAINNGDQAVIDDGGGQEAQFYPGGQTLSLNPSGMPEAINDSGAIAGVDTKNAKPAYSDGAGPAIDLAPADSIPYGQALAVNNAGDVVGISGLNPASATSAATIWPGAAPPSKSSGEPTGIDLNCLIPSDAGIHLTEANAINSTGSILAQGLTSDNASEWVVLTPKPESAGDRAMRAPLESGHACPLYVTAEALEGSPAAGLTDLDGMVVFQNKELDPAVPPITEHAADAFTFTCFSGCTNIVVNVKDGAGKNVSGATVTASLGSVAASPPASFVVPSRDEGFICGFPSTSACRTEATATTNSDGNAYFRYWLPGIVNLGSSYDPVEVISVTATGCSTVCTTGTAESPKPTLLNVTLKPHLYANEDRRLTLGDIAGLQALLHSNAQSEAKQHRDADRLLKLLYDSGIIKEDALKKLLDEAKGIAESDEVDELLRRAPKLVELDWFMTQLSIPSNGLDYNTTALAEWGDELADDLGPMMIDYAESKLPKGVAAKLKQYDTQINDAVQTAARKVLGESWVIQVDAAVDELIHRKPGATVTNTRPATMTLKLFEVSRCFTTKVFTSCPLGPLQSDGLFMAFSAIAPRQKSSFAYYQSPNAVGYNPQDWIRADCRAGALGATGKVDPSDSSSASLCAPIDGHPAEVATP